MTPAEVAAFVERGRGDQGLPPRVTDPAVIAKVASLARTQKQKAA